MGLVEALSARAAFGHISVHEVFECIAAHEGWHPGRLGHDTGGRRTGWWSMSESAEAILDQLVTWRELGFSRCLRVDRYYAYEELSDRARGTLAARASDP